MNPQSKTDRFTKIYLALWGIFLLIAFIALVFYKFGFRLTGDLEPVKVGSIELRSNETGLQIFLDNKNAEAQFLDNEYKISNVTPGLHSLMVYKEGFWPWAKNFSVFENTARQTFAFIFPMAGIQTSKIDPGSSEYKQIIAAANKNILPELPYESAPASDQSYAKWLDSAVPNRKISADKSSALFTEGNSIYLGWVSENDAPPYYFCEENPCKSQLPVTVSIEPVKNIGFYKNRRDVILFSAGAAIYAIEADREGTQNFQPIYKGTDPYFYENADRVLYIKDGASIFKAAL